MKRGPGQPTKLTPQLQARMVELIERGNYPEHAAMAVGVSKPAYYKWVQRGNEWRDADGPVPERERPYVEFAEAISKARGLGTTELLGRIRDIGTEEKQWTALAWILERTQADSFARREQLRVGGADGGPIRVIQEIKEPDFIREVQAKLIESGVIELPAHTEDGDGVQAGE